MNGTGIITRDDGIGFQIILVQPLAKSVSPISR